MCTICTCSGSKTLINGEIGGFYFKKYTSLATSVQQCFLQSNLRFSRALESPGGYSWEFLVGVCRPGSPNPDPISDQKIQFSAPVFRPGLSAEFMLSLRTGLERKQTNSSKRSNSHISLSFLLIWNWNDKYFHTLISIGATFYLFIYLFIYSFHFIFAFSLLTFFADFIGDNQYCIVAHLE